MPTHTSLKNVSHVGDSGLSDILESSLYQFFQWGMLGIGGFFNVNIDQSGAYGGTFDRLRLSENPNYTRGQVWQGFRKDWVWETDVEYEHQPIRVSGVYVDGDFYPTGTVGDYSFHIDYPNGQIVFDNPISTGSVVTCEYSHRLYSWHTSDYPGWRRIQNDSFRVDDSHFLQYGSGNWSPNPESRIQLPAVVIEVLPHSTRIPKEIGGLSQIVRQDAVFHVMGETHSDVMKMHDILTEQEDKRIRGVNTNLLFSANAYPLDEYGDRASGALMYPDLVQPTGDGGYMWGQIRFAKMRGVDGGKQPPFYYATVRGTFEVDSP